MFDKTKVYIISIPGANTKEKKEIENFLHENGINAKVMRNTIEIMELRK